MLEVSDPFIPRMLVDENISTERLMIGTMEQPVRRRLLVFFQLLRRKLFGGEGRLIGGCAFSNSQRQREHQDTQW